MGTSPTNPSGHVGIYSSVTPKRRIKPPKPSPNSDSLTAQALPGSLHSCFTSEPLSFLPLPALHLQVQQTPGVYGTRSFLPHWIRNFFFSLNTTISASACDQTQSDVGQWNR